jgi:hypothetical protein
MQKKMLYNPSYFFLKIFEMRIPYRFLLITIFLFFSVLLPVVLLAQDTEFQSIHVVEQQYYKNIPFLLILLLLNRAKTKPMFTLKKGR